VRWLKFKAAILAFPTDAFILKPMILALLMDSDLDIDVLNWGSAK
jgi:hypothetical protein